VNWYGFLNVLNKKLQSVRIHKITAKQPPETSIIVMNSFFDQEYFRNTIADYLTALSIIIIGTLALQIIKNVLLKRLQSWSLKTSGTMDDVVIAGLEKFGVSALQFAVIYWGLTYLTFSVKAERVIHIATSVIVTYFILRLISTVILMLLQNRIRRQDRGEDKIKQLGGLMLIINIVIWLVGIVFLLDNLNYNVTTIITGLGIGGIAIALAAQNILGDLFNYFVIFFDRPFEAGDFIVVDDKMGTVEYVGIKTTRVRSLGGEQIIIGNSNLTGSRIHNFKRLVNRRIVFTLNIDYRTPNEKLRLIPSIIRQAIERQKPVLFDRCHFASFGDWSIRFEVVYFVLNPDFNKYMDIQQSINLEIKEAFQQQEIYFATAVHFTLAPPHPIEKPKEEDVRK
jgi:small-conductance mechanosensitive channel